MPFQKVGPNVYVSPSGRKFNAKQVRLYYASDGFKPAKLKRMKNGGSKPLSEVGR